MALTDTLERNAVSKINGRNQSVSLVPGGKEVDGTFVPNAPKAPAPAPLPSPSFTPTNTIDATALSLPALRQPSPVASDFAEFENFMRSAGGGESPFAQQRADISSRLRNTITALGQKSARQGQIEADMGVQQMQQQLMGYNMQIANLKGAFDQAIVNEEGVARPIEFITGRQDFLQNKKLAQVNALTAVTEALQGNVEIAQQMAKDAVDREFAAEEAELEALYFDYQTNKEDLERDDKKAADKLANYLSERARLLTEKKDERNAVIALAQQAALDGAPHAVVNKMIEAGTQEAALALGSQYIGALDRAAKNASIRSANASAALNELQLAKEQAIQKAVDSGAVVLNEDQQKTAMALGKQFEDESKGFKVQVDAYNRILAASEDPSAAGDLALIFAYMKMLDPTSVVRETEFANAQNAAGVPEQIRAQFNKVRSGQRLTDTTRRDFIERSANIYSTALDQQVQLEEQFKRQATDLYGLPVEAADLVIRDIRSTGAATSEVVFNVLLNQASDEQLRVLQAQGLLPSALTTPQQ